MKSLLEDCFEELSIRPMTKQLVENLMMDLPLSPAQTVDFGVDSADHYRALQRMVRDLPGHCTDEDAAVNDQVFSELRQLAIELDQALGNGAALNALVRKYVPEYAELVHFHTSWDVIFGLSNEQAEEA